MGRQQRRGIFSKQPDGIFLFCWHLRVHKNPHIKTKNSAKIHAFVWQVFRWLLFFLFYPLIAKSIRRQKYTKSADFLMKKKKREKKINPRRWWQCVVGVNSGGLPPLERKKPHFGAASRGNLVTPCKAEQRIQANLFRPKLFPFHFEHWVLSSEASLFCGSCEAKFYGNIQMHTFIPTN